MTTTAAASIDSVFEQFLGDARKLPAVDGADVVQDQLWISRVGTTEDLFRWCRGLPSRAGGSQQPG